MSENKLKLEFGEYTWYDFKWRNKWRDWALLSVTSWDSWTFDIFYQEWNNAQIKTYERWEYTWWWSDVWTYEWFSIRLWEILNIQKWEAITYQCFNAPEEPILSYTPIDNEKWNFIVEYECEDDPWAEWVKPINIEITKEELIKTFYISFIKRIPEYYKWTEWYKWNLNDCESLLCFFKRDIDIYLKEHWVKNIDNLVKKARDTIKKDISEVYEMYDYQYYNQIPDLERKSIAEEFLNLTKKSDSSL